MQHIRCERCGAALIQGGGIYVCPGCGAKYAAENACRVADEMARLLDEQKQERVANLRQQLWKEFNEEFYDRAEISRLAKGILNILPDDFFAQFCVLAAGKDMHRLNAFLYAADVRAQSMYVWDMLSFLLRPLREETLTAVNDLLSRAREAELDRERFNKYNERLAAEAQKLDAGVYDVTLPRDVFLAYSSADMATVGELAEALEAQKISCFVAVRNLQHGAIQNYEEQLHRAMDHCRTVVFVSSKNSRSRTCDVLKRELPYLQERDLLAAPQYRGNYAKMPAEYKKPRLEYLLEEHTGTAADAVVEEFFAGCEYCYDAKTAAQRILKMLSQSRAPAVKYCLSCGAENPKKTKFCMECGGHEFADTYEEYEQAQRAKAEAAAREAEAVRRAEEEKKRAETERRRAEEEKQRIAAEKKRAEEEKKKAEEEAAALRAELERLKKAEQEAAAKPAEQPAPAPNATPASKPKPAPAETPAPKSAPEASPLSDFEIKDGVLIKYKGKGGEVVIPNSVKSIGDNAFENCRDLTSIAIPNSVKSIGWGAFYDCTRLTSITIPNSVTSIGNSAFCGCTGLTSITIPNSVTSIGCRAFEACSRLTSITIPNSVTKIENSVFDGCTGLTSITIPNSVVSIGEWAFANCTGLTSITIPNSVTSIENSAFLGCSGLTSITIPNSVTSIKGNAFASCLGLISITIPNSVTVIGSGAFWNCKDLTSIIIPDSVKKIGESAIVGIYTKVYCRRKKPLIWPKGWDKSLKGKIIWDK